VLLMMCVALPFFVRKSEARVHHQTAADVAEEGPKHRKIRAAADRMCSIAFLLGINH
jgi:hypothetical protein